MTLTEFIAKYTNQAGTGDSAGNKGQCVGLVEVYVDDLNLPHIPGNAKDLLDASDPRIYTAVVNQPMTVPLPGDIVVWGDTWGNGFGHTGICVSADVNEPSFECFEQNDPDGSPPHLKVYPSYDGVIGWIHPKIFDAPIDLRDYKTELLNVLDHFHVKDGPELIAVEDDQRSQKEQAIQKITQLTEKYADYDTIQNQLDQLEQSSTTLNQWIQQQLVGFEIPCPDDTFEKVTAGLTTLFGRVAETEKNLGITQKELEDETQRYKTDIGSLKAEILAIQTDTLKQKNEILPTLLQRIQSALDKIEQKQQTVKQLNILQRLVNKWKGKS